MKQIDSTKNKIKAKYTAVDDGMTQLSDDNDIF